MEVTLILTFFIILVVLGMPIAYSLAVPCVLYFIFFRPDLESIILLRIFSGFDAYTFIALPLFVTMGKIMSSGGVTKMIIDVSLIVFGRFKGGLALVNVFASMIFGGISGSSVADTASIGSILIPEMIRRNYSKKVSTGVTVASSTVGMIIPPSLPMVIFAVASFESVGKLFLGGAIPGIAIGSLQLLITYILARKKDWPSEKTNMNKKEILNKIFRALPALIMPVFIVGIVVFGVTTATEAAGMGVLYATICGFFIYRELNLEKLLIAIKESIYISASLMLIVTFTMLLGWIITVEGIPEIVGNYIFSLNLPNYATLLLFGAFLLFIGNFLDVGPAILLVTPVFLPVMRSLGIDPITFGVVLIVGLAVGLITPPVGQCLNVASKISGLNIIEISISSFPWALANIIVLILVCLFPQMSLFLVKLIEF